MPCCCSPGRFSFSASINCGTPGFSYVISDTVARSVSFTDTSIPTPTSWLWDFGDSTTSTEQNPTHVYSVDGTYTVTLIVNAVCPPVTNSVIISTPTVYVWDNEGGNTGPWTGGYSTVPGYGNPGTAGYISSDAVFTFPPGITHYFYLDIYSTGSFFIQWTYSDSSIGGPGEMPATDVTSSFTWTSSTALLHYGIPVPAGLSLVSLHMYPVAFATLLIDNLTAS